MPRTMRSEVADSWQRSAAAGVEVDASGPTITLPQDHLADYREAHPLAQVYPLLDDVLGQAARASEAVMALSDDQGQLLWVTGTQTTLRRAEAIGFVEGSTWDERVVGTNAPGTALVLGRPTQVTGEEHFREDVRPWNCVAAPIHDPVSGRLLGVLDITGGADVAAPQSLAMVRAAARLAEAELLRSGLLRSGMPSATSSSTLTGAGLTFRLEALGRREALLRGPTRTMVLSPRHSDILTVLAAYPTGLTGDELAVQLYETEVTSSTLRAELNRLRTLVGEEVVASRPYRLTGDLAGDWHAVRADLVAGDLASALRHYVGPLLPHSQAPGIRAMREELEAELRGALLASRRPDLLAAWTRSAWGSDDYEAWAAQASLLPAGSPLLPMVRAQVARLDRELR